MDRNWDGIVTDESTLIDSKLGTENQDAFQRDEVHCELLSRQQDAKACQGVYVQCSWISCDYAQ